MGDVGDTYRAFDEATKLERKKREDWAAEVIKYLSVELEFEYKVITRYHFRIRHPNTAKELDYFPRSGKATWVGSQKFFMIEDIEKYLMENFQYE